MRMWKAKKKMVELHNTHIKIHPMMIFYSNLFRKRDLFKDTSCLVEWKNIVAKDTYAPSHGSHPNNDDPLMNSYFMAHRVVLMAQTIFDGN